MCSALQKTLNEPSKCIAEMMFSHFHSIPKFIKSYTVKKKKKKNLY